MKAARADGRVIVVMFLGLIVMFLLIAVPLLPRGVADTTTAPEPAPRHLEWDQYEVGGYVLLRPLRADSSITLPPGAQLYIPRWVHGADPLRIRTES